MTLPYQGILKDAERYRWLKKQKNVFIYANDTKFEDEDGYVFTPEIILCASGTQFGIYATFNQTIDAAMKLDEETQ